jgi:hypothetical protein
MFRNILNRTPGLFRNNLSVFNSLVPEQSDLSSVNLFVRDNLSNVFSIRFFRNKLSCSIHLFRNNPIWVLICSGTTWAKLFQLACSGTSRVVQFISSGTIWFEFCQLICSGTSWTKASPLACSGTRWHVRFICSWTSWPELNRLVPEQAEFFNSFAPEQVELSCVNRYVPEHPEQNSCFVPEQSECFQFTCSGTIWFEFCQFICPGQSEQRFLY